MAFIRANRAALCGHRRSGPGFLGGEIGGSAGGAKRHLRPVHCPVDRTRPAVECAFTFGRPACRGSADRRAVPSGCRCMLLMARSRRPGRRWKPAIFFRFRLRSSAPARSRNSCATCRWIACWWKPTAPCWGRSPACATSRPTSRCRFGPSPKSRMYRRTGRRSRGCQYPGVVWILTTDAAQMKGGQLSDDHHQWQLSQTSFCGLRISFAVHTRCLKGKHDYLL